MVSSVLSRRSILQLAGAAALPLSSSLLGGGPAQAAAPGTLTIAYNVNLPSFDPTVGPSAVNPTIQAIYRSVFDQFIGQKPDLAFEPGLLTGWGWKEGENLIVRRFEGARHTEADWRARLAIPLEFLFSDLRAEKTD